MSEETRNISVKITIKKYEDLPEWLRRFADDNEQDPHDIIEGVLGSVLQIAAKRWYDSKGQQFLTTEPIVESPILL